MQIEWMEKVCVQVGKMNKIVLFEIMQIITPVSHHGLSLSQVHFSSKEIRISLPV